MHLNKTHECSFTSAYKIDCMVRLSPQQHACIYSEGTFSHTDICISLWTCIFVYLHLRCTKHRVTCSGPSMCTAMHTCRGVPAHKE